MTANNDPDWIDYTRILETKSPSRNDVRLQREDHDDGMSYYYVRHEDQEAGHGRIQFRVGYEGERETGTITFLYDEDSEFSMGDVDFAHKKTFSSKIGPLWFYYADWDGGDENDLLTKTFRRWIQDILNQG